MNQPGDENKNAFKSAVTITVVGVAVLTFVIIFLALFAGLWIDRVLDSKPLFTLGLVIISIPVTILLTLWLVRRATRRLKPPPGIISTKDTHRGTDYNS
jgi:ABC-type transport system involved in cytochrome c biogenesis permease subunit